MENDTFGCSMRVRLRLQRFGRKKLPFYRIVATSSSVKRDGRFLEIVGLYHPTLKDSSNQIKLDKEKILSWLNKGASPSETVKKILSHTGLWKQYAGEVSDRIKERKKRKKTRKKSSFSMESK